MFVRHVETYIDCTIFDFQFKYYLSHLLLKIIIYCVTDQPAITSSRLSALNFKFSVLGMSCPSWQWHRTGSCWSPVQTLPVAPLWCDLGLVQNSCGNKAVANLSPTHFSKVNCLMTMSCLTSIEHWQLESLQNLAASALASSAAQSIRVYAIQKFFQVVWRF